jgi:hypothetical protein
VASRPAVGTVRFDPPGCVACLAGPSVWGIETYYGLVPDGNETVQMTLVDGT